MIDFQYLRKGVCALANAHRAGTMAGHLGAATVTGYFFGEDHSELPDEVFQAMEGELDRVIAGEEAIWFNARKAGITPNELFASFPEEDPEPESISSIADALEANIGSLKQSGHNVIFAAAAIRAVSDHQEYATPNIVSGVRKLTEAFNNVSPGKGYFGKEQGWVSGGQIRLADTIDFPAYQSIQDMVNVTVAELITTAASRRQGFGGLWHIINHAAAITELDRYGYRKVARLGLPAHHQHIRLWRTLPDLENELGAVDKAGHDPREPAYWQGNLKRNQARLTHRIKTLYGFATLRRLIEKEDTRNKADDAFLYLMA